MTSTVLRDMQVGAVWGRAGHAAGTQRPSLHTLQPPRVLPPTRPPALLTPPPPPSPRLLPQGYAWFFYCYEATVHALTGQDRTRADLSYGEVMAAGVMAGFGLWGSMFPIDTIKSKMQVGGRGVGGR